MNCHKCERTATGVCRFCGRATCPDHEGHRPFVLAALAGEGGRVQVLAVEEALFCGSCRPRDDFVELPPPA